MKQRPSLDPRWSVPLALAALIGVVGHASAAARTATAPAPVAKTSERARVTKPALPAKATLASAKTTPAPAARNTSRKRATARRSASKQAAANTALAGPPMPAATGGMIVAIDPETGMPGAPSPEQIRALMGPGTETLRTDEGLIQIHHPSGAIGIVLDERYQEYSLVRVGPGGKKYFGCLHGDGHMHEIKSGVIPAPAVLEEE